MYIIEFSQTRPNTNILFFGEMLPVEFIDYFTNNYVNTGKFLDKTFVLSDDRLTITITHIWNSEQDLHDYENDEWIINNFLNPSIDYRNQNGIIQQIISSRTI